MPIARTPDGVEIHYEDTVVHPHPPHGGDLPLRAGGEGAGLPILFVHEFAGDHRSWAPQVAHFARTHRVITYAARGYPPSEVPSDVASYSQALAVADAVAVLDAAGVEVAHVVGLSMGGFAAMHLVLRHPDRLLSAVVAGVGYGSQPNKQEQFRRESSAIADAFASQGSAKVAESYAVGPARVQLQNKNPEAWREFAVALAEHDAVGAALTMRGVQVGRPSLYDLTDELRAVRTPVLVLAGDEDEGALEPSLMLKRTIPTAGLAILPRTGHTANLEEPAVFNEVVERFIGAVERGEWKARDSRAVSGSITGAPSS